MKGFKLVSVAALVTAFTQFAFADAPTFYGLINKELRYMTQDSDLKQNEITSVTDVDGFESRLGAKGKHGIDHMDVHYKMELGINSNRDNGNAERIRIRLAYAKFAADWGAITLGQNWTPQTLRALGLDPFTGTGAQALGYESNGFVGDVAGHYGLYASLFHDMISFESKNYGGFQFHITQSRDLSNYTPNATDTEHELLFTYDKDFSGFKLKSHLAYVMHDYEKAIGNEPKQTSLGAKFMMDKMSFSFAFTDDNRGKNAADKDIKYSHMFVGFDYMMNDKWTIAFNYGSTDFGKDDDGTAYGENTNGKQSQIAIGGIHKCSDQVSLRVAYKSLNRELETGNNIPGLTTNKNTGGVLLTGVTVKF